MYLYRIEFGMLEMREVVIALRKLWYCVFAQLRTSEGTLVRLPFCLSPAKTFSCNICFESHPNLVSKPFQKLVVTFYSRPVVPNRVA